MVFLPFCAWFIVYGEGILWKADEACCAPLPLTPARLLDGSPESATSSIALGLAQALQTSRPWKNQSLQSLINIIATENLFENTRK